MTDSDFREGECVNHGDRLLVSVPGDRRYLLSNRLVWGLGLSEGDFVAGRIGRRRWRERFGPFVTVEFLNGKPISGLHRLDHHPATGQGKAPRRTPRQAFRDSIDLGFLRDLREKPIRHLAVAAGLGWAAFSLVSCFVPKTVPDVTGLSRSAAVRVLDDSGLGASVDDGDCLAFCSSAAVCSQSVKPGEKTTSDVEIRVGNACDPSQDTPSSQPSEASRQQDYLENKLCAELSRDATEWQKRNAEATYGVRCPGSN